MGGEPQADAQKPHRDMPLFPTVWYLDPHPSPGRTDRRWVRPDDDGKITLSFFLAGRMSRDPRHEHQASCSIRLTSWLHAPYPVAYASGLVLDCPVVFWRTPAAPVGSWSGWTEFGHHLALQVSSLCQSKDTCSCSAKELNTDTTPWCPSSAAIPKAVIPS